VTPRVSPVAQFEHKAPMLLAFSTGMTFARVRIMGSLLVLACGLTALLLGGCGGQSTSAGSGGSAGSEHSQAGAHAAGAGKSNEGGAPSAGGRSGASGSASGGSSGSAGSDACSGPPTLGDASCSAIFLYYTFDAAKGLCVPFEYGGCGATANAYRSLDECQRACPAGSLATDACTGAGDCVLGIPGCCGPCDGPNITTHDFIAYNRKYVDQVATCGDVACGPCPQAPPAERTAKYFVPNCAAGRCIVEDLRQSAVTACEQDSDCQLRYGTACCPSCDDDASNLIAVRGDGSFEELVCASGPLPCLACVPPVPNALAICQAGRCAVAP